MTSSIAHSISAILAQPEIFCAGVSTIAIYTFLYKENPFYRFFEHFYIGIATAWGVIASIRYFLWPEVLKPLLGVDAVPFPDGSLPQPYNKLYLLYLLPMGFGLLYYFILSKRHVWLAELVIGFQLGYTGGLAFEGTFTELLPQVFNSFRPLYVAGDPGKAASNLFFLITLLAAATYFFFTFKRKGSGPAHRAAQLGRFLMMGCFGAYFGSTIMARMALLVERLDFLTKEWLPLFWS